MLKEEVSLILLKDLEKLQVDGGKFSYMQDIPQHHSPPLHRRIWFFDQRPAERPRESSGVVTSSSLRDLIFEIHDQEETAYVGPTSTCCPWRDHCAGSARSSGTRAGRLSVDDSRRRGLSKLNMV